MSFLLKIENIAKSSKILISAETFFSRSKDGSRTHDQKAWRSGFFEKALIKIVQWPQKPFSGSNLLYTLSHSAHLEF